MARLLPSLSSTPDDASPRVIGLDSADADDLIGALSSGTARRILAVLHEEPASASEVAAQVDSSLQNVQYHLGRMEDAGLVELHETVYSEKGREMKVYTPSDRPLVVVAARESETTGLRDALLRLLGSVGILGLVSVLVQFLLSWAEQRGAPTAPKESESPPRPPPQRPRAAFRRDSSSSSADWSSCSEGSSSGGIARGESTHRETDRSLGSSYSYLHVKGTAMNHQAEVKGIGVGMSDDGSNVPAVILSARDEFLPIVITADQAQAIQLALSGEPFERPLTHDLLVDMITEFGGAIDSVRIDDLADGTFYAKVDAERYEDGEPRKFVFDARPSDAIALSVRVDCPIVVSDSVLDAAGQPPSQFDIEDDEDDFAR
jgi:hypothetical protein